MRDKTLGALEHIQLAHDQGCENKTYEPWTKKNIFEKRRRDWILRCLYRALPQSGGVVVDLGCGYGYMTKQLVSSARVYGLDLKEGPLRDALQQGVQPIVCNLANEIPLKSDTVDAVVAGEIIEHIMEPEVFLAQVLRILKPGGKLILTTPNLKALISLVYMILRDRPSPQVFQPFHVRFFTFTSLAKLLREAGFRVLSRRTNEVLPSSVVRYLPVIGKPLCFLFDFSNILLNILFRGLGTQIMVMAEKARKENR
ncbi:MAG: methyltransferase domain-containing protein [Candidatus Omnitrophica bacterium]|nr:methyltransferase domain-containing protein [Candidatus Omnitrophota bacterium]